MLVLPYLFGYLKTTLTMICETKPVLVLSRLSYGAFLGYPLILGSYYSAMPMQMIMYVNLSTIQILAGLITLFGFSFFTYMTVEAPFLKA